MNLTRYGRIAVILAAGGVLTLVMIIVVTQPGRAAGPWYVAPGGDDGNDCLSPATPCASINGAIGKASSGDTIYVAIGTYTGTGDQVVLIDKSVTLSGGWDGTFTTQSGTSTIDGEGSRRSISVNSGVTATIERFVVQNGSSDGGGGIRNGGGTVTLINSTVSGNTASIEGGGIFTGDGYSDSILTLNNSTVSGNTANGEGGGIFIYGAHYGDSVTLLNNSTVSSNTSGDGGGVYNKRGTLTLNNSTVSGNTASGDGGGIYDSHGNLILSNSTVNSNGANQGGGVYQYGGTGTVTFQNTILAGNTAAGTSPDCSGTIASADYNLVGDTSGCTFTPGTGDLTDVAANLGPLIGPPSTPAYHPLLSSSPAIDAGNPAGCTDHLGNPLDTDQRGTPRPLDGDGDGDAICDMGAYEVDPEHPIRQLFLPIILRNY